MYPFSAGRVSIASHCDGVAGFGLVAALDATARRVARPLWAWSRDAPASKGSTTRRDTIPPIAPPPPTGKLNRVITLKGTDDHYIVASIAEYGTVDGEYIDNDKTLVFDNAYDLATVIFDHLVDSKGGK